MGFIILNIILAFLHIASLENLGEAINSRLSSLQKTSFFSIFPRADILTFGSTPLNLGQKTEAYPQFYGDISQTLKNRSVHNEKKSYLYLTALPDQLKNRQESGIRIDLFQKNQPRLGDSFKFGKNGLNSTSESPDKKALRPMGNVHSNTKPGFPLIKNHEIQPDKITNKFEEYHVERAELMPQHLNKYDNFRYNNRASHGSGFSTEYPVFNKYVSHRLITQPIAQSNPADVKPSQVDPFFLKLTNERTKAAANQTQVGNSADLWDWEGYYEVDDITALTNRALRQRNLFLVDTNSELGFIASLYDEEFSCRIFRNLFHSLQDNTLTSNQPIGYNESGSIEIKKTNPSGNLSGRIKRENESEEYLFNARKILDAPMDSDRPCTFKHLKGDYKGYVGDIPGIINIEVNEENHLSVVFSSDQYGSISTEIEATYQPWNGRLFMLNQKTSYPFIWRIIAGLDQRSLCSLSGFAFSTYNSQLRPANFTRVTP